MMKMVAAPLSPNTLFLRHMTRNLIFGFLFIALALFLGMCGYHYLEKMNWSDSFLNASMILSGMGPVTTLATNSGKIFAGSYALFSGLVFIAVIALIFSPIVHHIFRKVHLENARNREG